MTTNYESKKDGVIVSFIKEEDGRVFLKRGNSEFDVSSSTFKRWYKDTDKQVAVAESAVATLERPNVKVVEGIKMDPQEFKGTVSKKPEAPKVLTTEEIKPKTASVKKEAQKAEKAEKLEIASKANEALVTSLLQYGQKKGCDIIAHTVDTVLRLGSTNIVKCVIGKTTATMFFNFKSVPNDFFVKNKLECVPQEWKWALEIKVKVCEANQKVLLDLIDLGVNHIMVYQLEKENKAKAKADKKVAKTVVK